MINAEKHGDHVEVIIGGAEVDDVAEEFMAILEAIYEERPLMYRMVKEQFEDEHELQPTEEASLDDLFGECMKELDLFMKVRGDKNAKS